MSKRTSVLQGTLDLLVLSTLNRGALHGFGIVQRIQQDSDDLLRVEEGSLYPALHRLEQAGFLESGWRESETGRRARYYSLTARGQQQLAVELEAWERVSQGVARVLRLA
ncbi:MAG TPA: PadR family transcriptional regulator [Thermoanaerobaculia bacterium]|jgi:transcriptional regulator|nr:PadR family transcriptional regulator [Thermoanaerobaculia bacterium]